jgi:hypothetical protein
MHTFLQLIAKVTIPIGVAFALFAALPSLASFPVARTDTAEVWPP